MASKLILAALCILAFAAVASARPRFLAIPLEDIEFVQRPAFIPSSRVRRAGNNNNQNEPEAAPSAQYGSQYGKDYVDYGAYTGAYGAFGWYTDHPVGNSGKY